MLRMSIDAARRAALRIIEGVEVDGAYANLIAPQMLHEFGLHGRDAAFATELAFGTLRRQGWYDSILAACVSRPLSEVEADLRCILRMGAHQLLSMRVPDHAAVDTSCELARMGKGGAGKPRAGFVNAVLRKVAARSQEEWQVELGCTGDDLESLAARHAHPVWIARAFADSLGTRRTELESLLEANNAPARPVLVARPGRITRAGLLAEPDLAPTDLSPIGAVLLDGAPSDLPVVRSGEAGVQDEGSQLVALALSRAQVLGVEHDWLDLCAGPGGKAALLEGLAAEHGARLTAVELHPHRAELVRRSLARDDSTVLVGSGTEQAFGSPGFDRVLVDVPCTGLGALRRRPEARWRKKPADLAELAPVQRELLGAAIDATRPGGVIAYVTCSPHLAETDFVISDVLKRRSDVVQEDAHPLLPEVSDCGEGLAVQLWPHRHGTDAMFLAILRKGGGLG